MQKTTVVRPEVGAPWTYRTCALITLHRPTEHDLEFYTGMLYTNCAKQAFLNKKTVKIEK